MIRNLNVLDYEYSFRLVDAFRAGDYATAMLTFDEILAKGFNAQHFISALSSHLRDLLVAKTAGLEALLDLPASLAQRYRAQAEKCDVKFLYDALAITTQCEAGYKAAINQRLHIEFALMKLSFLLSGAPASRTSEQVPPQKTSAPQAPSVSGPIHHAAPRAARAPEEAPAPLNPVEAVAAKEAKPEPRRRTVKAGAALSLNSLMSEPEDPVLEKAAAEAPKQGDLTDEDIAAKWKDLAGLYPGQPRLANTLSSAKIVVSREDGLQVTFFVTNEAQRSWIESNKLHELEGKLQKLLGQSVKLLVQAAQFTEEKVIYTPEDKAKYLMENNPEVIDIISDLGLDIK